jgi:magnesium chelatase subunit I
VYEETGKQPDKRKIQSDVRTLKELINRISGREFLAPKGTEESGIAESLPFPFLALVGQTEMKLALILALINPAIGGVLLIGPRGTGKSTAVRSLVDLLPQVPRSLCYYGCLPEDIETGGIDTVCPDCARKYGEGEPLAQYDRVRLVELPLNARIEDVVGGIDERAAVHERLKLRRGILAHADRNLLYVDEVNMLEDDVVDALLDAASQGSYTVRRGPMAATYWSRFVLIGSMNPEEGSLRPQIFDRFGLRVVVRGLNETGERLEAYRRVQAYLANRRQTVLQYTTETELVREEIQAAKEILPNVRLPDDVASYGLDLIRGIGVDSLRAEIALFEASRSHAAADMRQEVTLEDITAVVLMALRFRRSNFIDTYFKGVEEEDHNISAILGEIFSKETTEDFGAK